MRAAPQRGAAWWVLSLPARQEAGRLQWSAELWSAPGGGQSLHLGFIGRLHWAQGCLHPRPTPLLDGARHPIPTYRPHPPPTFQVPRGLCGRLLPALPAAPLGRRWVAALWVLVCPGGGAPYASPPPPSSPPPLLRCMQHTVAPTAHALASCPRVTAPARPSLLPRLVFLSLTPLSRCRACSHPRVWRILSVHGRQEGARELRAPRVTGLLFECFKLHFYLESSRCLCLQTDCV